MYSLKISKIYEGPFSDTAGNMLLQHGWKHFQIYAETSQKPFGQCDFPGTYKSIIFPAKFKNVSSRNYENGIQGEEHLYIQ